MSTHRQHCFDIQSTPQQQAHAPDNSRAAWTTSERRKFAAFVLAAVAALCVGFLLHPRSSTQSTPIKVNEIQTRDLPSADELHARHVQARLEDWRAGYEAAVENGCKVQPLLGSPLSTKRP